MIQNAPVEAAAWQQVQRRRRAAQESWGFAEQVVLIGAGERVAIPGRGDLTYPFRAHSEYLYLTDRERPGGVLAFDPGDGWVDFVVPVTREEQLWEGARDAGEGVPIAELERWLAARAGRPLVALGVPPPASAEPNETLTANARRALNAIRRVKDTLELERMRIAERATSSGFRRIADLVVPEVSERAIAIEIEAEFQRAGATAPAYETIVASGPNAAVLHFAPTDRRLRDGELVLIDAGAEYRGYASDVTRTYPASGVFTSEQAELYAIVRAAELAAIGQCAVGTEWRDVHRCAALVVAEGLVEFRLLRGSPESLLDRGAVSLFFPHGVGHMVGLGVRDAGDVLPGREPPDGYPALRVDLPLEAGYVVTVEPGVYFVPALLQDPDLRGRHREAVSWERADALLGLGGIRLEDNVLITGDGNEVLTADVPHSGE